MIDPVEQSIESVEVNSLEDIKRLIGFDTLESDAVGSEGDRLYFDEECFLRGAEGRFQIDSVVPVAGKGVVVGASGDAPTLSDVAIGVAELSERIKYL
jgi:hypothetical protein